MYPTQEDCMGMILILLQQKPLCVPELCVNIFDRVLNRMQKEFGDLQEVPLDQIRLASWMDEHFPIEWIITCQACDDLLMDNVITLDKTGRMVLTEGFKRLR